MSTECGLCYVIQNDNESTKNLKSFPPRLQVTIACVVQSPFCSNLKFLF